MAPLRPERPEGVSYASFDATSCEEGDTMHAHHGISHRHVLGMAVAVGAWPYLVASVECWPKRARGSIDRARVRIGRYPVNDS
jgi:hypothetical protein